MTGLTADRRTQFLARLRDSAQAAATKGPIQRGDTGPVPLSLTQEFLRFIDRQAPDGKFPSTPLCLRLRGELDARTLHAALAAVVGRHEALRTAISEHEDGPLQVVAPVVPVRLPLIEVDGDDHEQRLAAARALVERQTREPVDLGRTPPWRAGLIRIAPDDHLFFLDVSAYLCDAWSYGVLLSELAEYYRALRDGEKPRLSTDPVQFPDYTVWQRDWLLRSTQDELAAYWRDRLAGAEFLEFPTDRPRGRARTFGGHSGDFTVRHESLRRARELARREGTSLFDVLAAAFLTLLHRYSGQEDLVIGSPEANRADATVSSLVGLVTRTHVLRVDVSGDPAFRELVRRVGGVSREAGERGDLPLGKLADAVSPAGDLTHRPIFPIWFGLGSVGPAIGLPGITTSHEPVRAGSTGLDMNWTLAEPASPGADGFLSIEYDADLFDAESIARFARHYDGLLDSLTSSADAPLSAAEMLSAADRQFLAEVSEGPKRPIRESTIVREFEGRVHKSPDGVALVVSGAEISYVELNARANQLAALLRERGIEPGRRVGLCLNRNADLTTAILAVLKTGAAYVPFDTKHPAARVAEIAADAGVCAVIAHAGVGHATSAIEAPVITLDDVRDELATLPDGNPPLAAGPGDVAYVIYTSGSTGKPKGVLLEHRGVVNFIDSTRDLFDLTPADRVLGFASLTFDVSVFETFAALLTGGRLYLATDEERLSVDRLQALLERAGITVVDLPPTVMPLLTPEKLTDLRIAFVGGEAFNGKLVNRWSPGRRLFNGYGPTECTVTMIVQECLGTWDASPPIGLPMANHVAHVLDRQLAPVPTGVPGELVIGGVGLARGYLNRDELTAEKFVADPFGTAPGGRLYRTGDLVSRLSDGRLVFLGRLDQQVKIRGLRIELGEVEAKLAGFDGIGPVCVNAWTDAAGDKHLVGYVTDVTGQRVVELREYLGALLPSYMIPSYFVVLDQLPLTSSGKVDRRKLPAPDPSQTGRGPSDESLSLTERTLLREVLAPLLRNDRLGVRDDFFAAGGNSLQAVQLMSAIKHRFAVEIALGDFFLSPTVARLAAAIDTVRAARSGGCADALAAPADNRTPVVLRSAGPVQVILLHPSGGELFCYIPLVKALRADIGVIGFAADPRDAAVVPGEGLVTSAARIARTLVERDLLRSCALVGWSYGGVLAFEVGRQIEQATGQRPPIVLLDAAYDEDTVPLDESTLRRRFVHDVVRLGGQVGQPAGAALGDSSTTIVDLRATFRESGVELALTDEELAARFEIFRFSALAMQAYRPTAPYGGPVTVLTASPHIAMEEQWRAACTGPFLTRNVPGDHYTLFTPPALSWIVAAVEDALTY